MLAIHRPFLANLDCHKEELLLMGHNLCFEAGRFDSNSIFVDGFALFPQMDVWSRNAVDPIANGSPKANRDGNTYST